MKWLAIEKECGSADWSKAGGLLEAEAHKVYQYYLAGYFRELYFNEEHNAVIILECESREQVDGLLNTLPLVKNGLIKFEIMQLKPYTGFDRILNQ